MHVDVVNKIKPLFHPKVSPIGLDFEIDDELDASRL